MANAIDLCGWMQAHALSLPALDRHWQSIEGDAVIGVDGFATHQEFIAHVEDDVAFRESVGGHRDRFSHRSCPLCRAAQ